MNSTAFKYSHLNWLVTVLRFGTVAKEFKYEYLKVSEFIKSAKS